MSYVKDKSWCGIPVVTGTPHMQSSDCCICLEVGRAGARIVKDPFGFETSSQIYFDFKQPSMTRRGWLATS